MEGLAFNSQVLCTVLLESITCQLRTTKNISSWKLGYE